MKKHLLLVDGVLSKRGAFIVFTGFILFTLFLYWDGLFGSFVLDDYVHLQKINLHALTFSDLLKASMSTESGPLSRPIAILTLAMNQYFNPNALLIRDAFDFKLVNLIIHLSTALIIYQFLSLLLKQNEGIQQNAITITVLFTTVLWMIHPLEVSTVLYVIQRMTELSSLFIMLGLTGYLLGRQRLIAQLPYAKGIMISSFLVNFILAILSKETGILMSLYLITIEYIFFANTPLSQPAQRFINRFTLLFGFGPLLLGCAYFLKNMGIYLNAYQTTGFSLVERIYTQIHVLFYYLQLILLPNLQELSLYHDDFPITSSITPTTAILALGILGLIVGAIIYRKKYPILAFGILWFFASHVLESTILPLEMVFEHRNYLAILGLVLPIGYAFSNWCISTTLTRKLTFKTKFILCLIFTLFISSLTYSRNQTWSNPIVFIAMNLEHHPKSSRIHTEWANIKLELNELDAALDELKIAATLAPHNAGPIVQQVLIHCNLPALPDFLYQNALHSLSKENVTPYAINSMDQLVQNRLRNQCSAVSSEKIYNLIDGALHNTKIQHNQNWLSMLYQLRSRANVLLSEPSLAILDLTKAYALYPKRLDPLVDKATIEIAQGWYNNATSTIQQIAANGKKYGQDYSYEINQLLNSIQEAKSNEKRGAMQPAHPTPTMPYRSNKPIIQ